MRRFCGGFGRERERESERSRSRSRAFFRFFFLSLAPSSFFRSLVLLLFLTLIALFAACARSLPSPATGLVKFSAVAVAFTPVPITPTALTTVAFFVVVEFLSAPGRNGGPYTKGYFPVVLTRFSSRLKMA